MERGCPLSTYTPREIGSRPPALFIELSERPLCGLSDSSMSIKKGMRLSVLFY